MAVSTMSGDIAIITPNEKIISNNLLKTLDQPSSVECLYSSATIGQSVSVV